MITRTSEGATPGSGAEQVVVRELADHAGVVLCNFLVSGGRAVRETDLIVLTPLGLAVVEVKGTDLRGTVTASLNGAWRIGDKDADFAGGSNPVSQVRKCMQFLRKMLSDYRCDPGYVVPVVCVVGPWVTCPTAHVGDTIACSPDGLNEALQDSFAGRHVNVATALAILAALDVHDISPQELREAGFSDEVTGGEALTSRERRILRKRRELTEHAVVLWKSSNRRRVIASGISAGVAGAAVAYSQNGYALGLTVLAMGLFGLFDLFRRHTLDGPRTHGFWAALTWILTLGPAAGVGAVASLVVFNNYESRPQTAMALLVGLLLSLAFMATALTGKSSFVFPPAVVVERTDPTGKPLGVFYLVDVQPRIAMRVPTFHADEDLGADL